jgi:hypothetical protein
MAQEIVNQHFFRVYHNWASRNQGLLLRAQKKNISNRSHRFWVSTTRRINWCIFGICASGCNAVDGHKDKQGG